MKNNRLWFCLFVLPILFVFLMVVIVPMFMGVYYSFNSWNGVADEITWVGFDNYLQLAKDEAFFSSFIFTAKFAIVSVFTINIIGFSLALLVTRNSRLNNALRSIFFMPNLIGGLILGFVWSFIFTKAFNSIGKALNIDFLQGWLSTTTTGFWGLVILMSWQLSGYMMIIYIAGLQGIPESLYEAAKIDGAGPFERLKNITLPMVAPAFTVGLFLTLSNSFKLYDQNLALTNGAPYKSTQMLALSIYDTAFIVNKFGLAQAKAIIFLITVAAITLTQLYFSKRKEVEM